MAEAKAPQLLTWEDWDQWLRKIDGMTRDELVTAHKRNLPGDDTSRMSVADMRRSLIVCRLGSLGLTID